MQPTVKDLLLSGAQLTDAALERLLPATDTLPHSIHRAMRHSTFAGGKRLRPILCMEAARMVAAPPTDTLPPRKPPGRPDADPEAPGDEGASNLAATAERLHREHAAVPYGVVALSAALD